MDIRFQTNVSDDYSTTLEINKTDSGVFVSILDYDNNTNKEVLNATHFLSKSDLSEFIGALLHLQSKLKGGTNGTR